MRRKGLGTGGDSELLEESHRESPGLWPEGSGTDACSLLWEVTGIRVFAALVSVSCLM